MKVFIDTNIWIDVIAERMPFFKISKASILACINDDIEMITAASSLKDIFYIIAKVTNADKAYQAIEEILEISRISTIDRPVCVNALDLEKPDYEDGIIAASALIEKADCIISRDVEAFSESGIAHFTPEEFLHHLGYQEIDL